MSPLHALETAAFAAWPSLEHEDLFGWHLRYAQGYTKRANSANATAAAQDLSRAQIEAIEARFTARGLRPIFRLTSFAGPEGLDDELAARGYQHVDTSLVMHRPLSSADATAPQPATTNAAPWLEAFQSVSGKLGPEQAIHLQMLQTIQHPSAFALLERNGRPAACGLGVLVDGQLGLFDIATDATLRRRGLASELCNSLLAWGRAQGAQSAYLQVTGTNAGAIKLYEVLGFGEVYRYWYRVKE
ncbi:GNAT family N-acetyltransferase [Ideonella azotifigens]|uniref:GNAT family N-acetyltransferase n=1 Tax=Ideonella azotifigens TaxID=513160 RepID=A0ABP3VTW7_9BURK|nr:GNAT family N-acetyltransferase [Ideonella azotifigens]MCD2339286.1 GNAT family N-acetyltransferase [Ideonella azotifigens]